MNVSAHDVIIIGGGLMGLSTALHLSLRGQRCLIIERRGPARVGIEREARAKGGERVDEQRREQPRRRARVEALLAGHRLQRLRPRLRGPKREQGLEFVAQYPLKLEYKGRRLRKKYIPDFICFGKIIVEIKAEKKKNPQFNLEKINLPVLKSFRQKQITPGYFNNHRRHIHNFY